MPKISGGLVMHFLVGDADEVINGDRESACGMYNPETSGGTHIAKDVTCESCKSKPEFKAALYTQSKTG